MSDVEVRLTADVGAATKNIKGFRKEFADLVTEIEKPLSKVNSFRTLESSIEATAKQMRGAKDSVRGLADEMARAEKPSKALQADYRNAVSELKRLERQEQAQIGQLQRMRRELAAAGVDTRNLAAEEKRLQAEYARRVKAGRIDANLGSAKKALGVGEIEATQRALATLRQQYQLVSKDSSLSAKQRSEAEATYRRSVAQTLEALRTLRAATAAPVSKADAAAALRGEAAAAAEAAKQNKLLSAQRALGVGSIRTQQQALVTLREQYRLVTADASLSGRQRAEAESAYRRQVNDTLAVLRRMRGETQANASKEQQAAAAAAQRQAAAKAGIRAQAAELQRVTVAQRQANLEAARASLGVTRSRELAAEVQRLRGQYDLLRQTGGLTNRELAQAQQMLTRRTQETRRAMSELAGEQQRVRTTGASLGTGAGMLASLGGGLGAASALRSYIQITDASKNMDAQLRIVTNSQEEFNRAQDDAYRIAQKYTSPLQDVVTLYARLTPALADIGRGQSDVAGVTEALTAALKVSGATTAESSSTLTQFSQALGSGVLRGQEFNSVAESAPVLMRALAKGLGVPTGALRGMAAEGLLTADVITDLTLRALPDLVEQASKIPTTVDGSLTTLRNDLIKAFGEGDTSGFIEAINQLRVLLTDPEVVRGLLNIAAGMATLAGWVIKAAAEFAQFANEIAYAAAQASGYVTELEKVEKTLEELRNSKSGSSFMGASTMGLLHKWFAPELLDEWIKEEEAKREELRAKIYGVTVNQLKDQEKAADQSRTIQENAAAEKERIDNSNFAKYSKFVGDMKSKQTESVKNAEEALKGLVSAEKKAAKDLEVAKQAQIDTQKRYSEALSGMQAGGAASYAGAQALKVAASQALSNGDIEGAKASAQAALDMLQELAQSGENTYGFEGFIKSLQYIEEAADQISVDKATQALDDVKLKGIELKALLDSVKSTIITVMMDDASMAKVRNEIIALGALSGKPVSIPYTVARVPAASTEATVTIPPQARAAAVDEAARVATAMEGELEIQPTIVGPEPDRYDQIVNEMAARSAVPAPVRPELDQAAAALAKEHIMNFAADLQQRLKIFITPIVSSGDQLTPPTDGFAAGGFTGLGGKYEPAGVVHRGEHVQPQRVVREPGALSVLEAIRRNGVAAVLDKVRSGWRGYAEGGLVLPRFSPDIPSLGPAMQQRLDAGHANIPNLGRLDFNIGGESHTVYVDSGGADALRKAARKRGRTH